MKLKVTKERREAVTHLEHISINQICFHYDLFSPPHSLVKRSLLAHIIDEAA